MLLSEVYEQLNKGELRQIAISDFTNTVSNSEDANGLLPHVRLALSVLHRRFPLRTNYVYIQMIDGVTEYQLHPRYAVSNTDSLESSRYILDTEAKPFLGDLVSVEQIFDECGEEVPLNNSADAASILMPNFNTIMVRNPIEGEMIKVCYREDHPRIVNEDLIPEEVEILLPWTYMDALVYHVTSRIYASVPTLEGRTEQTLYVELFEKACRELENKKVYQQTDEEMDTFKDYGWV